MTDIFLGPKRYVQRPGALAGAGAELKAFGRRPMILGDDLVFSILRPVLENDLRSNGLSACFVRFGVECSLVEVARVADIGRSHNVDVIVGTGGGKAIDTARAVTGRLDLPLVTLPTSAATCSAASTVTVLYENGNRTDTVHGKAAELVLVDSTIVATPPGCLPPAGGSLGHIMRGKPTYDQTPDLSPPLRTALSLSTHVKKTIFDYGLEAKQDVDAGEKLPGRGKDG